jgi:hypothetical protein
VQWSTPRAASSNKEAAAAGLKGMASELITSASKPRGFLATPSYLRLWFAGGIGNAMRWLELLVAGIFTYTGFR